MRESQAKKDTKDLRGELPIQRRGGGRMCSGVPELAWFRGHHSGVFDAYRAIQKKYPEAAHALLTKFLMDKHGNIGGPDAR